MGISYSLAVELITRIIMLNAAITQLLKPFNCLMKSAREHISRLTTVCPLRLIANGATKIYCLKEFVMLYCLGVPVVAVIVILLAEFFIIRALKTHDGCKETTEPDEGWYPGKLIINHFHRKGLFFKKLIGKEVEPNADCVPCTSLTEESVTED